MKLAVIGCGKMGLALCAGAIRSAAVAAADVVGVDPNPDSRRIFHEKTGARVVASISETENFELVLLCTKPGMIVSVVEEIAQRQQSSPALLVSIAAGISTSAIEAAAGIHRVIRVMPNTPALVNRGASAFCRGQKANEADALQVRSLLESVGYAVELPERLMNAVTGVSGSGPAYIFMMIEAMADGGVRMGLPREEALRLAAQTALGAAAMVMETGEHPAALKDSVTSPGGTTIAGLAALEAHGVRSALINAVSAASQRASELGD